MNFLDSLSFYLLKLSAFRQKVVASKLCFLLFCLFPLALTSQAFKFKNYTVAEGLAQSQVFDIAIDNRQIIWMATQGGGISAYDGISFTNYSTKDGLSSNYINCIEEITPNTILAGSKVGLDIFNGRSFEPALFPKGEKPQVNDILTAQGTTYLLTDLGLYTINDKAQIAYLEIPFLDTKKKLYKGFVDKSGTIWIGSDIGAITKRGDDYSLWNKENGLSRNTIRAFGQDEKDRIWISAYGAGLDIISGDSIISMTTFDGLSSRHILELYHDEDGSIWMGTLNDGICKWDAQSEQFEFFTTVEGLCNNHIRTIKKDDWGNYWIGSSGGGISKYSGQQFDHFTTSDGLGGNSIYAIEAKSDQGFWATSSDKGINAFDGSQFTNYARDSGFMDIKCKALITDKYDRLWIGTEGAWLCRYDSTFTFLENGHLTEGSNYIRDFAEDKNGNIWVATSGGGIYFLMMGSQKDSFEIRHFGKSEGLISNEINCLLIDKNDQLWYGTPDNGIGVIDLLSFINKGFDKEDGLTAKNIRSLALQENGNIWAGSAGKGVYNFDPDAQKITFKNYSTRSGLLTSDNIYLVAIDQQNQIWIGTESGIDRGEINAAGNLISIEHFGRNEGFTGIETCQNSQWMDPQGNLYFGTVNGLMRYNPAVYVENEIAPTLHFEDVELAYIPIGDTPYKDSFKPSYGPLKKLELAASENQITFVFKGIDHLYPQRIRYQWMLKGLENQWSPPSARNQVMYSSLGAGNYSFQVRAVTNKGSITSDPITIDFSIKRPFWRHWWFLLGVFLLFFVLLLLLFKAKVRKIKSADKAAREKLEIEKTILGLEQKALQLQMNPHFIFNALNSIQGLIEQSDRKSAKYYLAKFSKLMRSTLEQSRSNYITLEDEVSALENYLSIEQLSKGGSFDYSIKIDSGIDPTFLEIPPLMIQPFVENAIKHGFNNLTHKGMIQINFEKAGQVIRVTIEDNGIGRKAAAQMNKDHSHESAALKVTEERLNLMDKRRNVSKLLDINDLYDNNGKSLGTQVILRIPFHS